MEASEEVKTEVAIMCDCGRLCTGFSDGIRLHWVCEKCGEKSDKDA